MSHTDKKLVFKNSILCKQKTHLCGCRLGLLLNVRDPANRFVSAFDWAHLILCDRGAGVVDPRLNFTGHIGERWDLACKHGQKEVSRMLSDDYHHDANEMAEAMCARGDQAVHDKAARDLKTILHANTPLVEHIGGVELFNALLQNESFSFSAVPLEEGFDFVSLIDSTVSVFVRNAMSKKDFFQSLRYSRLYDLTEGPRRAQITSHSTHRFGNNVSTLSEAGLCCMVRYYRQDYQLLPKFRDVGCHGPLEKECKEALQQM
mgnify:CR=1 FL=1